MSKMEDTKKQVKSTKDLKRCKRIIEDPVNDLEFLSHNMDKTLQGALKNAAERGLFFKIKTEGLIDGDYKNGMPWNLSTLQTSFSGKDYHIVEGICLGADYTIQGINPHGTVMVYRFHTLKKDL